MGLQAQRGTALLMFEVRKINKRLHITEDGRSIYSPPDFVKVPNRTAVIDLADTFNRLGYRCIDAIVAFEDHYSGIKWNRTNFP